MKDYLVGIAVGTERAQGQSCYIAERPTLRAEHCARADIGRPYLTSSNLSQTRAPGLGASARRIAAPLIGAFSFLRHIGDYDISRTR